jgi:hypothetical protein
MGVFTGESRSQDPLDPNHEGAALNSKVMVLVSSGIGTPEDEWRVESALKTARRLKDEGSDFRLIFEGAGTRWIREIVKPDHALHGLFSSVRDGAPAACRDCASAFGVEDDVRDAGILLLDDYHKDSNLNNLVSEKYQTITF